MLVTIGVQLSGQQQQSKIKRKEDKMMSLTNEQLVQLIERLQSSRKIGSFCNFTARFDGLHPEETRAFITKIKLYKEFQNIPDDTALRSLPLFLEEQASTWWKGAKGQVTTWNEALRMMEDTYSPKKPTFRVFMNIFKDPQGTNESTRDFLCRKRILLTELPAELHKECLQIDMVYGLLKTSIRERIPRDTIKDFIDLQKRANEVEEILREFTRNKGKPETRKRKRCGFCRAPGHIADVCRKKKRAQQSNATSDSHLKCYGCGNPGTVRSECTECNNDKNFHEPLAFC